MKFAPFHIPPSLACDSIDTSCQICCDGKEKTAILNAAMMRALSLYNLHDQGARNYFREKMPAHSTTYNENASSKNYLNPGFFFPHL